MILKIGRLFSLLFLLGVTGLFAKSDSLFLESIELPQVFFIKSSYYTVGSQVERSGEPGFLKFRVVALHNTYEVEGLELLRKLLHEIKAIERTKTDQTSDDIIKGASDSIESTADGFVKLVSEPVESVKGLGKAFWKLCHGVAGVFRKKEIGEKSTLNEKLLGSAGREIANELGVDVYSENPFLQGRLKKIARARLGGKGVAAVGTMFLPVTGIVSATMTASGVNNTADQLLKDHDRADLFQENRKALLGFGFNGEIVDRFLNLNYFSPREATYLRFYLEKLKGVEGSAQVLEMASRTQSVWEARKILYETQIAARAVENGGEYQKINPTSEGIFLELPDQLIFITPYDYLEPSPLGDRVLEQVLKQKSSASFSQAAIWNAGKITKEFGFEAFTRGIQTKSWLLFVNQQLDE